MDRRISWITPDTCSPSQLGVRGLETILPNLFQINALCPVFRLGVCTHKEIDPESG